MYYTTRSTPNAGSPTIQDDEHLSLPAGTFLLTGVGTGYVNSSTASLIDCSAGDNNHNGLEQTQNGIGPYSFGSVTVETVVTLTSPGGVLLSCSMNQSSDQIQRMRFTALQVGAAHQQ